MLKLRAYRDDDADVVLSIWWNSWHSIEPDIRHPLPLADWRARWKEQIVPEQSVVVVEDSEDGVVAFAAADLFSCELTQLFVAPARKRCGIGRMLLQWAQGQMPLGFELKTLARNTASRNFYERQGLEEEGSALLNPVNGMDSVRYRWHAPPR
jgi:GNAT superfamily N-acetyltransferase